MIDLLTSYTYGFGGIQRSALDFLNGYSLVFATFLVFVGTHNLISLNALRESPRLLKNLIRVNAVFCLVLVVLAALFFVLPPLLILTLAAALMLLATLLPAGSRKTTLQ